MNLSKARPTSHRMPIWLQQAFDRMLDALAIILDTVQVGTASTANLTALSAVNDNDIQDGSTSFVRSVRDTFVLDKTDTTSVVDGITVVATLSGTGRWLRQNIPDDSWRFQTDWYINAITGNDENTGESGALALASYAEFWRRTQNMYVPDGQTTNVYIMTDLPRTDPVHSDVTLGSGSFLIIQGTPTIVDTGTVTTYDADGSGAVNPYPARFTSAGVDFAGLEGTLVEWVDAEGVGISNYAWILWDQGGGPGGNCWVTKPYGQSISQFTPPAPASTYNLLSIPTVFGSTIRSRVSGWDDDTSPDFSGITSVRFLRFENGAGEPGGNQNYTSFSSSQGLYNQGDVKFCSVRSCWLHNWTTWSCWHDAGIIGDGECASVAGACDGMYFWSGYMYLIEFISLGLSLSYAAQFYNCNVLMQGGFGHFEGPLGGNTYTYWSGVQAWQFGGIIYGEIASNDFLAIDGGTQMHLGITYDGTPNIITANPDRAIWMDGRRVQTDFVPYRNPHTGDAILDWGGYIGLASDGYADGGQPDVLHAGVIGSLTADTSFYAHQNLLENASAIGFVASNRSLIRALRIKLLTAPSNSSSVQVQALVNGVAAITATCSGSATSDETLGAVAAQVQPGDIITFEVTTTNSGGFAAADLSISVELS